MYLIPFVKILIGIMDLNIQNKILKTPKTVCNTDFLRIHEFLFSICISFSSAPYTLFSSLRTLVLSNLRQQKTQSPLPFVAHKPDYSRQPRWHVTLTLNEHPIGIPASVAVSSSIATKRVAASYYSNIHAILFHLLRAPSERLSPHTLNAGAGT